MSSKTTGAKRGKMSNTKKDLVHGIDLTAPGGIESLLEFHRAQFGNATMSAVEGTVSTEAESTNTATVESNIAEGTNVESTESVEDTTDLQAQVEKWKSLSRSNEDKAKKNHARITELEAKAAQYETDSETFKNLKVENLNLLKKIVAIDAGIPTDLIGRLQGNTEEELRADAELLKPFVAATIKKSVQPVFKQGTDDDANIGNTKIASYDEHLKQLKNL